MIKNSDIETILAPKSLDLPERPIVKRVQVQQDLDSLGEDAFRIWVVLDDQTLEEERCWARLAPIEERIKEKLREAGYEQWPYLTFWTESQMQEVESGG